LTVVNIFNIWSGLFTILGVVAAFNIYVMGLIDHETPNRKNLPSFFILMRFFQFVIFLLVDGIMWQHLAIHVGWDVFTFIMFAIDNRYTFIEKEDVNTKAKTLIRSPANKSQGLKRGNFTSATAAGV